MKTQDKKLQKQIDNLKNKLATEIGLSMDANETNDDNLNEEKNNEAQDKNKPKTSIKPKTKSPLVKLEE